VLFRSDAAEYLEQYKIKNLIKKYSEFINYPIKVYTSKDVKEQVPVDTPEKKDFKVTKFDDDGNEIVEEEEEKTDDLEVTDEGEAEA
jgi:heat shock protein beta